MTKEEILELARQAKFFIKDNEAYSPSNQADHELTEHLERFAKLVAERERKWVRLTDEDLQGICDEWQIYNGAWMDFFVIDITAKLKEKNT